jgi:hypothetical protein
VDVPPVEGSFKRAFEEEMAGAEHDAAIADTREAILLSRDPDDRRALEAKLRMLQEDGGVTEAVDQGRRVEEAEFTPGNLRPTQAIQIPGHNEVELPVPTPEQVEARMRWAQRRKLHEFIPLSYTQAVEAFAKGGPMWLYLGNRDAVMAMPFEYRQELVRMVAEDSVPQSQEVGRDILKQTQSTDRSVTIEAVTGA